MFGRLPLHPSLVEDNPGDNEVIADSQAQWARHYRTRMMAREHFAAAEADSTLRRALRQRIYTDPARISVDDWVYFMRNQDRYWKGPARVVLKDNKSLHCVMRGNPLIINSDDVLLNKPNAQEIELEDLISLPASQQPPVTSSPEQPLQQEGETTQSNLALDIPSSRFEAPIPDPAVRNYDTQDENETIPKKKMSDQSTQTRKTRPAITTSPSHRLPWNTEPCQAMEAQIVSKAQRIPQFILI